MTLIVKNLTYINSGYCCLNSARYTRINAFAWYAVISTEMLNGLFVHSPNRGACCPIGSAALFITSTH